MPTYDQLVAVIDDLRQTQIELDSILTQLILELPSQALLPDGVNQQPFIIADDNGVITYIVRQTTPNTSDEKYQGMYRLPLATSEGKLVLVAPLMFCRSD